LANDNTALIYVKSKYLFVVVVVAVLFVCCCFIIVFAVDYVAVAFFVVTIAVVVAVDVVIVFKFSILSRLFHLLSPSGLFLIEKPLKAAISLSSTESEIQFKQTNYFEIIEN
jgi:hypothetical protein